MEKAIVLLSGGQDSTTCLGWAVKRYECIALTINYGQRHAVELQAAARVAQHFGVQHIMETLPVLASIGGSALVEGSELKAEGGYGDKEAPGGLPTSFVPGRNLLFLSIAGAVAVRHGAKNIVTGVCETDYSGYPDCREAFITRMRKVLDAAMPSDCGPFQIHTPLMRLNKKATVLMAHSDPATWEALKHSVTCYNGTKCGECPACVLRAKGFEEAGLEDPALAS